MSVLVSVVIPTKDRLPLLRRAIESVLAQTHADLEIIVVDDGSADGTAAYLQSCGDRVRSFVQPVSQGACRARNLGIAAAAGRYITFLDDDDEFEPERVARLLAMYRPELAFVCSRYRYIHNNGREEVAGLAGPFALQDLLLKIRIANSVLTETRKVRSVGGFDESLSSSQDYDLWVMLMRDFGSAFALPAPLLVIHTEHDLPRITFSRRKRSGHWRFYRKHKALMDDKSRRFKLFELIKYGNRRISFGLMLRLVPREFLMEGLRYYIAKRLPVLKRAFLLVTARAAR